jgi:mycoredoxin-dependent peroxiredoxin
MRHAALSLFACLVFPAIAAAQPPAPPQAAAPTAAPAIKVGDKAPGFSLNWFAPKAGGGYDQATISLDQYRGKQTVVLAFFPAAFSPGCTNELKQYQANATRTSAANTVVLGVSVDSTWANRAFREQIGAEFPILSDFKREAAKAYGMLNEASGVARRSTFVIDPDGIVQHVDVDRAALDPNAAIGACERVSKR